MYSFVNDIINEVDRQSGETYFGRVANVVGLLVEVEGLQGAVSVSDRCDITTKSGQLLPCEVVGFRDGKALVMPFGSVDGIGMGCRVEAGASEPVIYPTDAWLGRVIDAFGRPVDGKGPLPTGAAPFPIHALPPPAHERSRVGGKVDLGVRAMNTFLTCCRGQRLGIFAGSGVGKSTLLSMMARNTDAEVSVIGLVGERGREDGGDGAHDEQRRERGQQAGASSDLNQTVAQAVVRPVDPPVPHRTTLSTQLGKALRVGREPDRRLLDEQALQAGEKPLRNPAGSRR